MVGLLLTSCGRPKTDTLRIPIPEAASAAELNLIREALWEEQESLPDTITFFTAITTSMAPEPALEITYVTRRLRRQNVLYRIHQLGYTVEGRPGDPAERLAFLAESRLP